MPSQTASDILVQFRMLCHIFSSFECCHKLSAVSCPVFIAVTNFQPHPLQFSAPSQTVSQILSNFEHHHKCYYMLQNRKVAIQLVPQTYLVWPCCMSWRIVELAVLGQVFTGHLGSATGIHAIVPVSDWSECSCRQILQTWCFLE